MLPALPLALTGTALVALLWAEARSKQLGVWLSKPLASAGFVWLGLQLRGSGPEHDWLLLGLVLCMLGDVLLIPDDERAFKAGIAAFGLGHLAYLVSFVHLGLQPGTTGLAAGLLLALAMGVWRWLSPHIPADMRVPVAVYIVIITSMTAAAAGTTHHTGNERIALAAVAFFVSDLAVARDAFVTPAFSNRAWGLPLYYAAQLLFASCLVGL